MLVLADDVHWLDPASLEALSFALRRLDRDAIACVMTLRADIPALAGLPCRDLAGLGREAAAQLAEAVSGIKPAPAVAGRLHAETGGNPLALVELSAALTADQLGGAGFPELPVQPGAAIQQRFAVRLDQLSPQGRIALLVAAAAGRCPAAEVSAAAARLGADDSDALGEAEAAGMVRLDSGGVEFSHPLMRSVAYHTAVPAQRRAAHRALADVLAGRDASDRLAPCGCRDRSRPGSRDRARCRRRAGGGQGRAPRGRGGVAARSRAVRHGRHQVRAAG